MIRPAYKILYVLLFAAASCAVFCIVYKKGDARFNIHKRVRLTELFLGHAPHDVLFIGSSRTHTDIDPRIIDSICHVDSYNAGVEGGNLLEFYYTYMAYLVNHPAPKRLVLGLDLGSFDLRRRFFNYTIYMNYTQNPVISRMLTDNGYRVAPYRLLPFLILTDLDDYSKGNALAGWMGRSEIPDGDYQYKGFLSNTGGVIRSDSVIGMEPERKVDVDTVALDYLRDMIKSTERTGTKLVLVYGPEYKYALQASCKNAPEMMALFRELAQEDHLVYLRNDSLPMCRDGSLFANPGHLNKPGASVYSRILGTQLLNM